jgi:hypothetical protein
MEQYLAEALRLASNELDGGEPAILLQGAD